jgi:D-arabinose 1-dehydrogenase-like Zn-dependent alcohol dehydrogenase
VKGIKPGDRVVPHLFFSCNQCFYCLAGREQQCANLQGILGVLCPGAFAEYFKAPAENLFPLPESVPFDAGGLIADAVLTGLHAVRRAALQQGDSAAVLGAGGVGQIIIQILASSGVRVAAIDRLGEKLGIARDFGAEAVFDSTEETARPVIEFSGRGGVNCVFNCVGTPESMRLSADMIMRCGRIVVIGEEPGDAPLNTIEIAQRELEIIGSRNGTRREMAEAIQLVAEGVVRPYIAARFPLEDINQAFDCVRHGALGRVVVVIKD